MIHPGESGGIDWHLAKLVCGGVAPVASRNVPIILFLNFTFSRDQYIVRDIPLTTPTFRYRYLKRKLSSDTGTDEQESPILIQKWLQNILSHKPRN